MLRPRIASFVDLTRLAVPGTLILILRPRKERITQLLLFPNRYSPLGWLYFAHFLQLFAMEIVAILSTRGGSNGFLFDFLYLLISAGPLRRVERACRRPNPYLRRLNVGIRGMLSW